MGIKLVPSCSAGNGGASSSEQAVQLQLRVCMCAVQGIIETTVNEDLQSDPDVLEREASEREVLMEDGG